MFWLLNFFEKYAVHEPFSIDGIKIKSGLLSKGVI